MVSEGAAKIMGDYLENSHMIPRIWRKIIGSRQIGSSPDQRKRKHVHPYDVLISCRKNSHSGVCLATPISKP